MAKKKKSISSASRGEAKRNTEKYRTGTAKGRTSVNKETVSRRSASQQEKSRRQSRPASQPAVRRRRTAAEEMMEERRQKQHSCDPKVRQQEEMKRQQRQKKQARSRSASRHRNQVKNRRRNLWIFRILTWVIILAAGYFGATVFFCIDDIQLQGKTRYAQEELLDTLGISKGDNLFLVDRDAARQRLLKEYVYLQDVQIKRKLPNTLKVKVKECKASAAAKTSNGYFLLDQSGKILEEVKKADAKTHTMLYGLNTDGLQIGDNLTESGDERTQELFQLVSLLEEMKLGDKTTFVDVEKVTAINIGYDNRFIVNLGTMENMEQKIRFLQTITTDRLTPSDTGLIDISDVKTARFRPLNTLTDTELARMRNFDGSERSHSDSETDTKSDNHTEDQSSESDREE